MGEKILLTGGSGLLALNWAIARRDISDVILGIHNRKIQLAGVSIIVCNLESKERLIEIFNFHQPDVVIHTAGYTNVDACQNSPDIAEYINVVLTENVVQACVELDIPLVHISTDQIFSGEQSHLTESATPCPVNVYGKTKAMAEAVVLAQHKDALIIRTNFYGWGTSYRRSFSDFIIKNLRDSCEIDLFDDVLYNPINTAQLVETVHELLSLKASGIYHVVGDECLSKYAFGEKVVRKFDLNFKLVKRCLLANKTGWVRRPLDMSLSNQKVCKLLGKNMGDVNNQLEQLLLQEKSGIASELGCL